MIEKISNLLAGDKTLFLIDDIIANETLNKHHQPLLELAISGRHRGHSLWLLTQSYTAIPNNIRRQAKMLYVWYPKNRMDLNTIHKEIGIIGSKELARVKVQLKWGKHICLIMRMEHQEIIRFVEFYNRIVIRLLSTDYKTSIRRLQDFYQQITGLLSRDHRTPIDFL